MAKAPKHSKNRFAGTARPSGTIPRWITSPFFKPKETIMVGNHKYRFSSSSHGPDSPEFRKRLKESVATKKRVAVSEGRVLIARYLKNGTHYGVILYTRNIRSKRLRPHEMEAMGIKKPFGSHDKQLRFAKSVHRDRKKRD